ncbi:probable ADP-ribosylation factor GTPase-activating AGD14 isoform X1 [Olea europaea subsp. europaea]|uniref:Probable ADP-ribosylation factor GTPase-activating AGD14 isoform X1 n=1 Tax=Olea europaea subsp. europaea TaxID=158383 RepID=A0A8S0U8F8_OLEEU|nr:probable ADP-ribosylation factor GTPase-activating AGD14 isoform X1 [Olea europaea subsp. europaea]
MASRVKEDEKNEKIIRSLLKLPENRRCINCNSLGPQYVCTNFSTFVCTTCSGIHREFTHRVKSVSMAKFTSQEVSALQGGGNASAREIYLKEWDPQRNSLPDGSNIERLRDFIKHVYVDRRYTGGRSFEKPPRAKMGETEDYNENRRIDTYQGRSRNPPYEDTSEHHYSDRRISGGRSPGYDLENQQRGDYKKSPAQAEVVNDWRREDRFGNGRKSEDRSSDGGSRLDIRSPDHQRDLDTPSPPVVLPIREILGENVSPLRVAEPSNATGGRTADASIHTQRIASSSSLASSNENPAEFKMETSLIDFDSAPAPPVTAAMPQTQQSATDKSAVQPKPSGDNWANFDSAPDVKVAQAASHTNSVLDVLSELSIPASASGPSARSHGNDMLNALTGTVPAFPSGSSQTTSFGSAYGGTAYPGAAISNSAIVSPAGAPAASFRPAPILPTGGGNSFENAFTGGKWPVIQPQQPSVFPGVAGLPNSQSVTIGGPPSNQPWNSLVAANAHQPPGVDPQMSQPVTTQAMQASIGVATQSFSEVKASGRTELPADLFTANYYSFAPPVPGRHSGPFHGAGFSVQRNMPMSTTTFQQVPRSTNPFDVRNEPSPVQTAMFPSMQSLQGALPNVAPISDLGTSHLQTSIPTQTPSYASAIHPSILFLSFYSF